MSHRANKIEAKEIRNVRHCITIHDDEKWKQYYLIQANESHLLIERNQF